MREVSVEAINQRAYQLFEARGSSEAGQAVEDWLQAERELLQNDASSNGATASHSHSVRGGPSPQREPLGTLTA